MMTTDMHIAFCGCGALGSQIAWHLGRPDWTFTLVDDDVIERGNVENGTTIFNNTQIGIAKTVALAEILYRRFDMPTILHTRTLERGNIRPLLGGVDLIVDSFDNAASRSLLAGLPAPTLHVAVADDRSGQVAWDEAYQMPPVRGPREANPICTRALGRPILRNTAIAAARVIEQWAESGVRRSLVTTENLHILE